MKIIKGLPCTNSFHLPDFKESDGWQMLGLISNQHESSNLDALYFSCSGSAWTISLPSSFTADIMAGDHMLYLYAVANGSQEVLAASVAVEVSEPGKISHNRAMVTAIRALMEGRPTTAYESYTTQDGESITRMDTEKLAKWLQFYERRLASELRGNTSGGRVKTIQIGFR